MFRNVNHHRTSLLSLAVAAALLPLAGADCDTNATGPLFNPGGQSTPNSGPIAAAANGQTGHLPELSVGAGATQVDPNQTYNFGASVTGGQSPYYYFWMRSDEGGWSQGGPTWFTTANFPAKETRTMYCQVVDSNNVESNLVEITLTITQKAEPGCTTIAGSSWTSNYGNITFTVSGTSLKGVSKNPSGYTETIDGTLTQGDGLCTKCWTLNGRWKGPNNEGPLKLVFEPDLMSFSGDWKYDSGWGGGWTGSRSNCN